MKGNNMKMIAKLASCGILALTMNVANANQVSLAANAAKKVATNQAAVKYIEANTGVTITKASTNAELTAAIGTLSAADQIAMTILVNKFANKAVLGADAVEANSGMSNLFQDKSGQVIVLASAQNNSATRGGTKEAGSCAARVDSSAMAEGTRVQANTFEAAQDAGIFSSGTCAEDFTKMNKVARENIGETLECGLRKNVAGMKGDTQSDEIAGCLGEALSNDGNGVVALAAAKARLQGLNKCKPFGKRAHYAGQTL